MTIAVDHAPCEANFAAVRAGFRFRLKRLLKALNTGSFSSNALEPEVMPDHVKRDLGLLDGRAPYEEDRLRR